MAAENVEMRNVRCSILRAYSLHALFLNYDAGIDGRKEHDDEDDRRGDAVAREREQEDRGTDKDSHERDGSERRRRSRSRSRSRSGDRGRKAGSEDHPKEISDSGSRVSTPWRRASLLSRFQGTGFR